MHGSWVQNNKNPWCYSTTLTLSLIIDDSVKQLYGKFCPTVIISRALKIPVFKVWQLWDSNHQFMCHAGAMGSNTRVAKLWRLVILKPLKLYTSIYFAFFQFGSRRFKFMSVDSVHNILNQMTLGLLHKIANGCKIRGKLRTN